jgi:hypothetical protein
MDQELAIAINGAWQQLGMVWDAARGFPVPFHNQTDEHNDYSRRLSQELFRAWMAAPRCLIHCSAQQANRPDGKGYVPATLHGGRILVTQADRPPKVPRDLNRPLRWYLVDLWLLDLEGHRGVTINCRVCFGPHRLGSRWLQKSNTRDLYSTPAWPTDDHPPIADVAFAEVIGDPRPGLQSVPDLIIGLPPRRLEAFEQRWADHPPVLAYLPLLSAKRWILDRDHGGPSRQPAPAGPIFDNPNIRVAQWPPPNPEPLDPLPEPLDPLPEPLDPMPEPLDPMPEPLDPLPEPLDP